MAKEVVFNPFTGNFQYSTPDTNFIVLSAGGAIIPSTNGAEQKKVNGTNHSYYVLAFDDTTVEKSDWQFIMPSRYSGGNIAVTILWVATPVAGGVVFDVNFGHAGDSDSVDPALTNQACAVITVDGTSRDINTSSCTLTTPFIAGDYAIVRIHRETGDIGDTLVGDAEIVAVIMRWT